MLTVPVGTVTAQLPGQPLTNWTLGAPTYREKIEIAAESTPTPTEADRPVTGSAAGPLFPLPAESRRCPPISWRWNRRDYVWPFLSGGDRLRDPGLPGPLQGGDVADSVEAVQGCFPTDLGCSPNSSKVRGSPRVSRKSASDVATA